MKVAIIDDHPLVRRGLAMILALEPDIELAGEASNINEAIELILKTKPDMLLVDLRLGDECGLDLKERIEIQGLTFKFIVLTSSVEKDDFKKAEEANIDGYVLKEALPEEILYAIRIVSKGRKYYDPGIMDFIIKEKDEEFAEKLTPREIDVLSALGMGLSNSYIAKKLYITEFTVKKHVSQILSKLELTDRTQAALYANSKGLVKYQ